MLPISNFVSTALYNRFSQSSEIQKIAAGLGCLSVGKRLLCDPHPAPAPSLIRKIGRKAVGVAFIAGGLAGLYYGGKPIFTTSTANLKKIFLFGQNPDPLIREDRYEKDFRDPIEVLYLGASSDVDHNGVQNPAHLNSLPDCIASIAPMQYRIIRHPLQICEKILSASYKEPVETLILHAHGNPNSISLSRLSSFKVFDFLPTNCFDGLASAARIFMHSCEAGKNSLWKPNIAEWLSLISGREVIASTGNTTTEATCSQTLKNNQSELDIYLGDFPSGYTKHFNVSSSWVETALFSVKMIVPTILGAMVTWQSMRLGATVLQGSGAAAEWLVDRSAAPTKRLAERVGLYNPGAAQILYTTTKVTGKILNCTGKVAHQAMDKLIQPVSTLGNWMFGKSMNAMKTAAQTLYSKVRRS